MVSLGLFNQNVADPQNLFFIEFIGVTLVNKTIQDSNVQVNKTSSAYSIVYLSPKEKSPSITIYLLFALFHIPPPPFPLAITRLLSVSMCYMYIYIVFLNPLTFFYLAPQLFSSPTAVSLFSISMILLLFCLLNYFFIRFHI